ncbi:hypothetical protein [Mesorhizobium sp. CAU 1741]|uniref:NrdR family transcriptional regulator n=1 Tax=Mesorhizobium sp. CAU 1741 TaxID=3140366 RepID=UPI00325AE51A
MTKFRCSECGGVDTDVIDTQRSAAFRIRRRRKCKCGHRFSTVEIPVDEYAAFNMDDGSVSELQKSAVHLAELIDRLKPTRAAGND